jgi:hypothetical protein
VRGVGVGRRVRERAAAEIGADVDDVAVALREQPRKYGVAELHSCDQVHLQDVDEFLFAVIEEGSEVADAGVVDEAGEVVDVLD